MSECFCIFVPIIQKNMEIKGAFPCDITGSLQIKPDYRAYFMTCHATMEEGLCFVSPPWMDLYRGDGSLLHIEGSSGICHNVASEMASSIHTPACCLSKLRSSLEAGKKQLRVWREYFCSVVKMLLYPSLVFPLVFLWSSYGNLDMSPRSKQDANYFFHSK